MPEDEQGDMRANPGYAVTQFARALLSKGETATKQVKQWQQVLTGMAEGLLQIGSRTPVYETPPWITLEVAHGGFATGNFAAGGILRRHEIDKLRKLQKHTLAPDTLTDSFDKNKRRSALNIYFASAEGRPELSEALRNGCFRIHVPEEAALLISTWLIERGETDRAAKLLEIISPFFDRLRFYPEPAVEPRHLMSGETVYLQTAGSCAKKLREKRQQQSVLKMNESIKIWTPLYDRAVGLFIETIQGKIPELITDESGGSLVRTTNGQPIVEGGWPCKHYPADWAARVTDLLHDYEEAKKLHDLCKKHEKPKENFARLRKYLAIASASPTQLNGRDVGIIRKIVASYVTAHGAPGSELLLKTRAIQTEIANRPKHSSLAEVLAERLDKESKDEGVTDLKRLLVPLSMDEALRAGAKVGTPLPPSIIRKALACGESSLKSLIEQKLITSSEAIAFILPIITARIEAGSIDDLDLARVFADDYHAFRQRRSLMLFNLESQVRFEELPWISAIQPWIKPDAISQATARAAFKRVSTLAISAFPHTIMPNRLVKECRTLTKNAGISISFVDELAADIFTGSFAVNFLYAAQESARLLQGTIYERYYGIEYEKILALNDIETKLGKLVSPGFANICAKMAVNQISEKAGRSVASNGAIIEQGQIVTTHNLASLWRALDLEESLKDELPELARFCYKWVCRQQQLQVSDWRTELKSIKNCAYAWRQMLFYLSLCSEEEQKQFIAWADVYYDKQSKELKQRFAPIMQGLTVIMGGEHFNSDGQHPSGGLRFTGWSAKPHFLRRHLAGR